MFVKFLLAGAVTPVHVVPFDEYAKELAVLDVALDTATNQLKSSTQITSFHTLAAAAVLVVHVKPSVDDANDDVLALLFAIATYIDNDGE